MRRGWSISHLLDAALQCGWPKLPIPTTARILPRLKMSCGLELHMGVAVLAGGRQYLKGCVPRSLLGAISSLAGG